MPGLCTRVHWYSCLSTWHKVGKNLYLEIRLVPLASAGSMSYLLTASCRLSHLVCTIDMPCKSIGNEIILDIQSQITSIVPNLASFPSLTHPRLGLGMRLIHSLPHFLLLGSNTLKRKSWKKKQGSLGAFIMWVTSGGHVMWWMLLGLPSFSLLFRFRVFMIVSANWKKAQVGLGTRLMITMQTGKFDDY